MIKTVFRLDRTLLAERYPYFDETFLDVFFCAKKIIKIDISKRKAVKLNDYFL